MAMDIRSIWKQQTIPVMYREGAGKPLLVRLPFAQNNMLWLQNGRRNHPKWTPQSKHWELPRAWFEDTVERCLHRFKKIYVIQPVRKHEKCAPACWEAVGLDCECSCMGEHHGSDHPGGRWYVVSETCAISWHERELACRLLTVP